MSKLLNGSKKLFEFIKDEVNISMDIIDPDSHLDRQEHEDGVFFFICYIRTTWMASERQKRES
ncbi:hypothetical protein MM239_18385 [Belliella sp. DSM 111904]|uniref:Uncharacterized protein n=1 Tax=Belliella filtrata TaxID=2923435 RepID=A0ABS9V593_9BACT|nr:hypothetical protein [Belliella filtrata]MCH7411369.1 hypothetical protein [Belliella filtrata]